MASGRQYEFGAYRLDVQGGMLFREGDRVALPPKAAELLVALVQAGGRVLTREQLLQQLWPDTVVEEGSLTSHISVLRKALGEGPHGQGFIETYRNAATASWRRISGPGPKHRIAQPKGPCWPCCRSRTSLQGTDTTTSAMG